MLERSSRFILEVFPYLSAALIAAVIVPGYLYSQVHGLRAAATPAPWRAMKTPSASSICTTPRLRQAEMAGPEPQCLQIRHRAEAEVAYGK
jgi:hypothetical protein